MFYTDMFVYNRLFVMLLVSITTTSCGTCSKRGMLASSASSPLSKRSNGGRAIELIDELIHYLEDDRTHSQAQSIEGIEQGMYNNKEEHRIYYQNTLLDSLVTKVLCKGIDQQGSYIVPQQTIFHPKGGGQPDDQGSFTYKGFIYPVISLAVDANTKKIKHYFAGSEDDLFEIGDEITFSIDINKRKLYARLHTAGHLIANLIEQKYPELSGVKGNHFPGQAAVVFVRTDQKDVMPNKKDYSHYDTEAFKKYLEIMIPTLIQKGSNVIIGWDKEPRTIKIEGHKEFPCGGTHVQNINEIQNIVIKTVVFKNKEGMKVSYEVD